MYSAEIYENCYAALNIWGKNNKNTKKLKYKKNRASVRIELATSKVQ